MKYLKNFESINLININVEIFNINDAHQFLYNFSQKNRKYKKIDLKDKIRYFDYNDFNTWSASQKYLDTCRFFIAYNEKEILGICKFAYFGNSETYSISYLSVNIDFNHMGISKIILEKVFEYFSNTYPSETLSLSGYSLDGWKYLRKNILELSNKYKIKIIEKGIEYPGKTGYSDEYWSMVKQSKEEIQKKYNL